MARDAGLTEEEIEKLDIQCEDGICTQRAIIEAKKGKS